MEVQMAELTPSERQAASAAVAKALTNEHGSDLAATATPMAIGGDVRKLFCENWGTVKAVLQFLSDFLPPLVRPIVAIIIKAGDALHGVICH
jgi:hypothetical protein